jgi:hypothetical protein
MLKIKECPQCNRTFSDPSLSFCLVDGSLLSAPQISDEFGYQPNLFEAEELTLISKKIEAKRLDVKVQDDSLRFEEDFEISFYRTLKVPDDGKSYLLPAGLGKFPIFKVSDYCKKVPVEWNRHGGVFIPMYQREALFIEFDNLKSWQPNIVKVATGKINAVTGKKWHQEILKGEQDYVVVPPQQWLDGYKTGTNVVRQFVAMPLGKGYSVESQISGEEKFGGIQIIVFKPRKGVFSPPKPIYSDPDMLSIFDSGPMTEMGISAGGKIKQKIYEDKYGAETWDENHFGRVYIHIVNSLAFEQITGLKPPKSPIDIKTYQKYKIPWFEVYDEPLKDVKTSEELYEVKPIKLIDKIKGVFNKDDLIKLDISEDNVKKIKITSDKVEDGDW